MPSDGSRYETYPVSSLPREAVDGASEFNEYGRLSVGSPFRSFSLVASEQWASFYRFSVSQEVLQKLMGRIRIAVEVNSGDGTSWGHGLRGLAGLWYKTVPSSADDRSSAVNSNLYGTVAAAALSVIPKTG